MKYIALSSEKTILTFFDDEKKATFYSTWTSLFTLIGKFHNFDVLFIFPYSFIYPLYFAGCTHQSEETQSNDSHCNHGT